MNKKKPNGRGIGIYIIFFIVLLVTISVLTGTGDEVPATSYTDVRKAIQGGEVTELIIGENAVLLTLQDESQMVYEVTDMNFFMEDLGDEIEAQQEAGTLVVDYEVQHYSIWYSMLPYLIIIVVMGAFWMFMMNRQGGGGGNAMNFGKSRAKLANPNDQKKVTFQDVAGADEEKADLEEIVDFLKEPKKYMALGARIPKGVLLVGPPGTGKTLIAKAVAGEAGVPFFSISGSDFVELYVGVGASRVRDLFDQAKKHAPAIVFIDEIDAVGRQRGAGLGGGHDEREQTLNQLLVEMDGFGNNAGVIVMAATNRADILDPALLAAREGKTKIGLKDIDNAFLKVIMGNEKKNRVITEHERKITAYHEAGHALTSRVLPTQDPVQQVSIVPRGRAGGFTLNMPKEDKYYNTKQQMEEELIVLLGGRVAEKLIIDDLSTGASNDIQRATDIARKMVTKYGMSDKIGPIDFSSTQSEVFLGRDFANTNQLSEQTAALIDSEVKDLIHKAYERCEQILRDNMDILHRLAQFLLENETMDNAQLEAIYKGEEPPTASAKSLGQREEGDKSAREAMQEMENAEKQRLAEEAAQKAVEAVAQLEETSEGSNN